MTTDLEIFHCVIMMTYVIRVRHFTHNVKPSQFARREAFHFFCFWL